MSSNIKKNFIYQLILTLFNVIFPIIIMPYVLRVLGPSNIGLYTFFDSFAYFFLLFGLFGIPTYGFRELGKYRNDSLNQSIVYNELFSIGLITNALSSLLYFIIIVILYHNNSQNITIAIIIGVRLIFNIFSAEWVFQGIEKFSVITTKVIIQRIIFLFLLILLVRDESDLINYILLSVGYLIIDSVSNFILLKFYDIKVSIKKIKINFTLIKKLILILIMSNAYFLFTSFDKLVLGFGNKVEEVAYYRTAEGIINILYQIIITIAFVSVPKLVSLASTDRNEFIIKANNLFKVMLLITIPLCVGTFLLSKEIILIYAGAEYLNSIIVLRIFSVYLFFLVIQGFLSSQILFILNKEVIITIFFISIGIVNVISKAIFVNQINASITISMTLFLQIALTLIMHYYVKHQLKININIITKSLITSLLVSSTFIIVYMILKNLVSSNILLSIMTFSICACIYLIFIYFTNKQLIQETISAIKLRIK